MLKALLPAGFLGAAALIPNLVSSTPAASEPSVVGAVPAIHGQVPCGIYTDKMRVEMLLEDAATIENAMKTLVAMDAEASPSKNQMVRWVMTKEQHAQNIQERVASSGWPSASRHRGTAPPPRTPPPITRSSA